MLKLEFTKDDLLTGDIVELQNGQQYQVFKDIKMMYSINNNFRINLDHFNEDLIHDLDNMDIIKIYRAKFESNLYALNISDCDLIFHRILIPTIGYVSMKAIIYSFKKQ